MVRARLRDISRAGAALLVVFRPTEIPKVRGQVRIRLAGAEPTPWIEATIVGIDPERAGRSRLRLQFNDACPTYFLRVAVLGHVPEAPPVDTPPNTESESDAELPSVMCSANGANPPTP